jgi:hypothetical protein
MCLSLCNILVEYIGIDTRRYRYTYMYICVYIQTFSFVTSDSFLGVGALDRSRISRNRLLSIPSDNDDKGGNDNLDDNDYSLVKNMDIGTQSKHQ